MLFVPYILEAEYMYALRPEADSLQTIAFTSTVTRLNFSRPEMGIQFKGSWVLISWTMKNRLNIHDTQLIL